LYGKIIKILKGGFIMTNQSSRLLSRVCALVLFVSIFINLWLESKLPSPTVATEFILKLLMVTGLLGYAVFQPQPKDEAADPPAE
jgi:hypothetical protein